MKIANLKYIIESTAAELSDVTASIDALASYRDKCPRGSARRADFASSIRRLKAWQRKLEQQLKSDAESRVSKRAAKGVVSEGIVHFDKAKVSTIMPIIRKLIDMSGDLEVTEKVDGSPLRAGVADGKFYTSTKHGSKVFDVDVPKAYDADFLKSFAEIHSKLSGSSLVSIIKKFTTSNEQLIRDLVPNFDLNKFDLELAFEFIKSRSNVIAYDPLQVGEGALIILNITIDGTGVMRTPIGQKLIEHLKTQLKSSLKIHTMAFHDISTAKGAITVDVIKDFEEIERELHAAGNAVTASLQGRAQVIIDAIRDSLIANWVDLQDKNMLGGTEIEGLVIRDSQTGDIVKLVNREKYTQRGKDLWRFRNTTAAATEKFRRNIINDAFGGDKLLVDLVTQAPASNFKKRYGSITASALSDRIPDDEDGERAAKLNSLIDAFEDEVKELWTTASAVHERLRSAAKTTPELKVVDDNVEAEREQYDSLLANIKEWRDATGDVPRLIELITPKSRWMKKLANESVHHTQASTMLREGGNAFDDVEAVTFDEYDELWKDITTRLTSIGISSVEPIGSTGKKSVMGDIDVAIEVGPDVDVGQVLKDTFGKMNVRSVGGSTFSVRWPFAGRHVQVDIMVGRLGYLRWARFGVGDRNGPAKPIKGIYRNMLLNTLTRVMSTQHIDDNRRERLAFDFDKGLFKVIQQRASGDRWKRVKGADAATLVSDDPDEIIRILLGDVGHIETFQDLVAAIRSSSKVGASADDIFREFIADMTALSKHDKRVDMKTIKDLQDATLTEDLKHALALILERDATGAGGFAYEALVLKAIKRAGVTGNITKGAGADASRPDADIKIGRNIYAVEVKLDRNAQMGGTSIRWTYGKRAFEFVQALDPLVEEMIVDALRPVVKDLKAFVDYVKKQPGNREITGFPMAVTKTSWEKAQKNGWLAPLNTRIDHDASFVVDHYNKKGIFYVQIGGAGLFYMGSNPANLPIPALSGDISIEVRASRGGSTLRKSDGREVGGGNIRVQARLKTRGQSPYTLDDPESIKQMLRARRTKSRVIESLTRIISATPSDHD